VLGGAGSGNFGHVGIKGHRGGSASGGGVGGGDPELLAKAKELADMSTEERDNIDPSEFGVAPYQLYEAQKMMPKKEGSFKSVNDDNTFSLWQDADAVVNVRGKPFLGHKFEDPDDESDEGDLFVWAFSDPASKSPATIETQHSDKGEAYKELLSKIDKDSLSTLGGAGSGNFGHKGRKGVRGGSLGQGGVGGVGGVGGKAHAWRNE
jgi:hypothetical protein